MKLCEACGWCGETAHTCPNCGGIDLLADPQSDPKPESPKPVSPQPKGKR